MLQQEHPVFRLGVIGAGQLGSRHLQGLARLALPCEIDVVDPSASSLDTARARFEEMPPNPAVRSVCYHANLDALPRALDYVVVATASDVRLGVLDALLRHATVRSVLLEKVLFQRIDEYAAAGRLLELHRVKAWVNCSRRAWPIYSDIREFFAKDPLQYFQAHGGNWGLGCNTVHFLDLIGMLTGSLPEVISTSALDARLIPSKRKTFMEFTGSLRGTYSGGVAFEITSRAESSARLLLTLRSESRSCIVDEAGGCALLLDAARGNEWVHSAFTPPLLSELSAHLATQILMTNTCRVSSFADSVAYHLPLVRSLGMHAAAINGTPADFCPIT